MERLAGNIYQLTDLLIKHAHRNEPDPVKYTAHRLQHGNEEPEISEASVRAD